jgi:hypothetical protein
VLNLYFFNSKRCNDCASQETVVLLCCVADTMDIDGGATKDS